MGKIWVQTSSGKTIHLPIVEDDVNTADDPWYPYQPQRVVLFEYSGSDMIYRGINITHKAATSATNWVVWKYTYTTSLLVKIEGPLVGSWDGRAALDWA